jgi:hypothetical protein
VIDSDGPANRCVVPRRRVTSSNTAYSKASLQFQLLGREKGAFQGSTGVEVNFLDRRTRGRDWVAVSSMAEGKSEPEAENYPPFFNQAR